MSDKIRVGILGMGGISEAHIPNYVNNKRAVLAAICDSDAEWLATEKQRLGIEQAYTDYRELLSNPDIDAVVVCLPTYLHAEASIAALKAGKHVLCEKPMACTAVEAKAMCDAAAESGKKLMISHNQRFGKDIKTLHSLNKAGMFGELYCIRLAWRRPPGMLPTPRSYRSNGVMYNRNWFNEKDKGGGVLRDLGTHLLDLALYITDFPEMSEASCSLYRKFFPELEAGELEKYTIDAEDMAIGHIKFDSGLSMQLEVSFCSMVEQEALLTEIYGTKGGASRRGSTLKLIHYTDNYYSCDTIKQFRCETTIPDEAFLDCIINDTEPFVTGEQGMQVVKILDALYASGYGKL